MKTSQPDDFVYPTEYKYSHHYDAKPTKYPGLTAIEHAAIHTGQPCSGTPWLDNMLAQARRERLAGQALAGLMADPTIQASPDQFARESVLHADALIAALEGGAK